MIFKCVLGCIMALVMWHHDDYLSLFPARVSDSVQNENVIMISLYFPRLVLPVVRYLVRVAFLKALIVKRS